MDELDNAFQEIIDGAVSKDIASRIHKINPILKKYGLGLVSADGQSQQAMKEVPPPPDKMRAASITRIDTQPKEQISIEVQKLAASLDCACASFIKISDEFHFILRPKISLVATKTIELCADVLSECILSLNTGRDIPFPSIAPQVKVMKDLLASMTSVESLEAMTMSKKTANLSVARAALGMAQAQSISVKRYTNANNIHEIHSLVSSLYELCLYLQKFLDSHL